MYFEHDTRLGIDVPHPSMDYDALEHEDQERVLLQWELIRARIPDQIMHFERIIQSCLDAIHHEEDWDVITSYFDQISDYASRIHDLNMWRRVDPSLTAAHLLETASEHLAREKH